MAYTEKLHVQLNGVLLTENLEEFERQIIPHELAHLLVQFRHGFPGGHGKEWKATMRTLGLEPDRTHSLDTTNSRTTPVVLGYRCDCGPRPVSMKEHRSVQRGGWIKCKRCQKKYVLEGAPQLKMPGKAPVPLSQVRVVPRGRPVAPPSVYRPTPPAPSARAPTERMLSFASSLAAKHSITLDAASRRDFRACQAFLDKWSKAPVAPRPAGPVPRLEPRPAPLPAPRPAVPTPNSFDAPTERQLEYARSIASRKRLDIPAAVLGSKRGLSAWIDQHK